tara:strand:- start:315 stop:539 length:225 start_codon:yes stop_codon:yes gene_type:complete
MNVLTTELSQFDIYDNYFESEYCNSVLECADYEGNLSEANVIKLLSDHGQSYHEYSTDCGHDYHANTILSWLGY